jgi:hypothetical protein
MKVVFSDLSRARLHEIQSCIAFYNIRAAGSVVDRMKWTDGRTRALVVSGSMPPPEWWRSLPWRTPAGSRRVSAD